MVPIAAQRIRRILESALPSHSLLAYRLLEGGTRNANYLLYFDQTDLRAVLRVCGRDQAVCEKEIQISRSASGIVPVPEIIEANPKGEEDFPPYIIYRFAEGITFQCLKSVGSLEDAGEAAYAIGEVLAKVPTAPSGVALPRAISDDPLGSSVFERRIGGYERDRVSAFISTWLPQLRSLNENRALVHGDFNSRNIVVKSNGSRWIVSGILDWESAFAGSPLWDAARFICYERVARPLREPHFSRGYQSAGGSLPAEWPRLARIINTLTAVESLSQPDLPSAFVPELCDLVTAFVDNRDLA